MVKRTAIEKRLRFFFTMFSTSVLIVVYLMMVAAIDSHNVFNANGLEAGGQSTVTHDVSIMDILTRMCNVPPLFKVLANFSVEEFEELASIVCRAICSNARLTGVPRVFSTRPRKWTTQQRLLNFIMYMIHSNVVGYESFQ